MVTKEDFANTLKQLKEISPKRKFSQSVDLIINFKDLDLKKPEEQVDVWVPLDYTRGKTLKIGAFVGPELTAQAKTTCDTVVVQSDFKQYEGKKKEIKKLAKTNDYFIAQANIMPDVAKYFGRYLGPRGKMPNPKAGGVVPPNANLKIITDRLKRTIHITAKTQMSTKCSVGKQDAPDDQLLNNIMTIFNAVLAVLPQEQNNIKNVLLKYSMGPPLKVGAAAKKPVESLKPAEKKAAAKKPAEASA